MALPNDAPDHPQTNASQSDGAHGRLAYEPPRLTYLGSFKELTKGGGLSGQDVGVPFGARPGSR